MIRLKSYLQDQWKDGAGDEYVLHHAVTGEPVASCSSQGLDLGTALAYGRETGGPRLRAMTFPERAALLKEVARVLNEHLPEFYEIAATYGATKADAWGDIEGGIITLGVYASLARKGLPDSTFLTDGDLIGLSKAGGFAGQHIYVPREGVAVQINAYNFPAWGMLEKLGPAWLAGMPALIKPAAATAWLAYRMVEVLAGAGVLPPGSLQLLCGGVGDLLEHVTSQDMIAFTGSAETGYKIKSHPNVVRQAVRLNLETDSLNAVVLGPDVSPESTLFQSFIKEIVNEMTTKAGQRCTAIRRILAPRALEEAAMEALRERLGRVQVGDPAAEGVKMGPLVSREAAESARQQLGRLARETTIVSGDPDRSQFNGVDGRSGAFMEPILLHCANPTEARAVHEVEVFGPVATVMGYDDPEQAVDLVRRGGGSLVASVYSEDEALIKQLALGLAPYHGRLLVINGEAAARESTGHGMTMPQLVHGGPGRAGGGEELGGLRSVLHYMQRVAVQGAPDTLQRLCRPAVSE